MSLHGALSTSGSGLSGSTRSISGTGGITAPATTSSLGAIIVGDNLLISADGTLSVDTTNVAEEDNTKPITSAGTYMLIGNIEAFLATI